VRADEGRRAGKVISGGVVKKRRKKKLGIGGVGVMRAGGEEGLERFCKKT
jgi:hypothetical protein